MTEPQLGSHSIRINPNRPSPEAIRAVVDVINRGGVVAYPTETFYGLGTNALNSEALGKIFALKGRSFSQAILVLIPTVAVLPRYVKEIPSVARELMSRFWPGPLTLIFSASSVLPAVLCAQTGKIAVRISSHPIAQALTADLDKPLTSTSANLSGLPSPTTPEDVFFQLGEKLDLIIDGGKTLGGQPSTVIDITQNPPKLIREGSVPFSEIESTWR